MARFKVKIHTNRGVVEKEIDAVDKIDAEQKATRAGTVISVKKALDWSMGGLSFQDRQIFFTRLAAMLSSGVGAGDALRIIHDTFKGRIKSVTRELLMKIESGSDLPTAISEIGHPDFPDTTVALIKAGSQGGATATAIKEANKFEREMAEIRKGSAKGLIGAFITFLLSVVFIAASVYYMMPKVMDSDMMKMSGDDVNIDWVMNLTDYIGYFMIVLLAIMVVLGFLGTVGKKIMPAMADRIILKIPVYKDLMLSQKNYISFYGMSLLVGVGVRMEAALALTYEATQPGALKEDFKLARDAVRNGQPWALAMKTIHDTDRAALSASLDREQVANALQSIADQYRDIYASRISLFVPMMQGIGSLFMMVAGIIMFGVTILPMMQMMTGML